MARAKETAESPLDVFRDRVKVLSLSDVLRKGADLIKNFLEKIPSSEFNAFPKLEAPIRVDPEEEFTVLVGFRTDLDAEIKNAKPIHIENPPEDAKLLVVLLGDGVTILGNHYRYLALDMAAEAKFRCQAKPGVNEARLTVDYVYDSQVVGTASRMLQVGGKVNALKEFPYDEAEISRLGSPSVDEYVDITVTICKKKEGVLQWTFYAPQVIKTVCGPVDTEISLDEAEKRQFQRLLINEFSQYSTGILAANILGSVGQDIAATMPKEFFDVLHCVYKAIHRIPTILLNTEETCIPWELAYLENPLNGDLPPYLAAQTYIASWDRNPQVGKPPPVSLEATLFSVVASQYGRGSGLTELTEALKEQDDLKKQLQAYGLESKSYKATINDINKLIESKRVPGHLVHFVVHGTGGPNPDDNILWLADNNRLSAKALMGVYRGDKPPVFSFVFLNACQVGQAATRSLSGLSLNYLICSELMFLAILKKRFKSKSY